jgi:hypothetical protein
MRILLLIICLSIIFKGSSQEVQEKYQLAKINYNSIKDLSRIGSLGIPVDHGLHKKGYYLISDFSVSEIEILRNAGYSVEILIEDSKEHFLQQNKLKEPVMVNPTCSSDGIDYQTPTNFGLGSMGGYFTYQEVLDQLDLMSLLYPGIITEKENIGDFLTNGLPDDSTTPPIGGNGIKWIKISDNPSNSSEGEPQILYTAIHHAREPNSLSQLIFYMWYLLENYDSDPEVQNIINNTELYFVPVINPDGYLYNEKTDPDGGGFWRKNRYNGYGVDNNRNYDFYINGDPSNGVWGGEGTSSDPNAQNYHGDGPFSEIENQAIRWFVEQHQFVMTLNNHSAGNLLLYPYGYTDNMPTPENDLFEGVSEELVSQNGFSNIIASELYPAAGNSDDFMYGTVGTHEKIYSMTPEIGPSFWPPSNQIEDIAKGMMYLNLTAAKMINNYAVIEETSPIFVGNQSVVNCTFNLRRLGVSGSGDFTVSINPISDNIISTGDPVTFNNLDFLQQVNGIIDYTISNNVEDGDDIIFEIIINNGSYDFATQVNKKYGLLIPLFEDPGNSVTDNFDNNGWGTTSSDYVSPVSSITDSPDGDYQNNENKTITLLEEIDLTYAIGAIVNFYAKWEIEDNFDYVQFEVSLDGGISWIPQCGKYTNEGSNFINQPTGEPLYDGVQNEWVLEEIDLSDYLGEHILIRYEFDSDASLTRDGFYFDDLSINILDDGTLGDSEIERKTIRIYPNPVKENLNVHTLLADFGIEIFNIQGQLINYSENNEGSISIDFSGYSRGIYFLKLTSNTISKTFKVVKD